MKKIEQEKQILKKIGKKTGENHRESNLFRLMEDHMTLSTGIMVAGLKEKEITLVKN